VLAVSGDLTMTTLVSAISLVADGPSGEHLGMRSEVPNGGECDELSALLAPGDQAAEIARVLLSRFLGEHGLVDHPSRNDVLVVGSELVSMSCRTGGLVRLEAEWFGGSIRVSATEQMVANQSGNVAEPNLPHELDLIEGFATRWGTSSRPDGLAGIVAWAEVALPPQVDSL
jgi:hypothetical protein